MAITKIVVALTSAQAPSDSQTTLWASGTNIIVEDGLVATGNIADKNTGDLIAIVNTTALPTIPSGSILSGIETEALAWFTNQGSNTNITGDENVGEIKALLQKWDGTTATNFQDKSSGFPLIFLTPTLEIWGGQTDLWGGIVSDFVNPDGSWIQDLRFVFAVGHLDANTEPAQARVDVVRFNIYIDDGAAGINTGTSNTTATNATSTINAIRSFTVTANHQAEGSTQTSNGTGTTSNDELKTTLGARALQSVVNARLNVQQNSSSGGVGGISWSMSNLDEGGLLTISTSGSENFGVNGPTVMYRQKLTSAAVGSAFDMLTHDGRGVVTANMTNQIVSIPEMPYGRSVVMGAVGTDPNDVSLNGIVRVTDTERVSEFFDHYYFYFPTQNQINAEPFLTTAPSTWQIKPLWHLDGVNADSDTTRGDIFHGCVVWHDTTPLGWTGTIVASNDSPVSTFDGESNGLRNPNNLLKVLDMPVCRQFWVKAVDASVQPIGADGYAADISTTLGVTSQKSFTDTGQWTPSTAASPGYDRFTFPGFVRGFLTQQNAHLLFADVYVARGVGAAARVEITDSSVYDNRKKITICDIDTWSSTAITARIAKGIFWNEDLLGKHLWITDENNSHIYAGRIL